MSNKLTSKLKVEWTPTMPYRFPMCGQEIVSGIKLYIKDYCKIDSKINGTLYVSYVSPAHHNLKTSY